MSDKAWEAIMSIMFFFLEESRPRYKGSFISFVEESKYIWQRDTQPDRSSLGGRGGTKMAELDSGPQQLWLWSQAVLSHLLLNQLTLAVDTSYVKFSVTTVLDFWPARTAKKCSFPGRLDNKGGVSGSALQYRKSISSALFLRRFLSPSFRKAVVSLDLKVPAKRAIRSTHCHLLSCVEWWCKTLKKKLLKESFSFLRRLEEVCSLCGLNIFHYVFRNTTPWERVCLCYIRAAHKPKNESAAAIVEDRISVQNFLFITFQKWAHLGPFNQLKQRPQLLCFSPPGLRSRARVRRHEGEVKHCFASQQKLAPSFCFYETFESQCEIAALK